MKKQISNEKTDLPILLKWWDEHNALIPHERQGDCIIDMIERHDYKIKHDLQFIFCKFVDLCVTFKLELMTVDIKHILFDYVHMILCTDA